MPANHIHLSAIFEKTDDIININNDDISNAAITLPNGQINGNAEFNIDEATVQNTSEFENVAGESTIGTYLDLSLNEVILKGTETGEAWKENITTLSDDMTVSLILSDELKGKDEYTVIRSHEGTVEEIPATYNEQTNTLTFETNKYSTYAIAYKVEQTNLFLNALYNASIKFGEELNGVWKLIIEQIDEETYAKLLNEIKEAIKKEGVLLGLYDINVQDINGNKVTLPNGPYEFRIKMTEEMKKYNSFKFTYVDIGEDGKFTLGEEIEATIDGEYLVVKLPHLSPYAITGEYIENTPKTGDTILITALSTISLVVVANMIVSKKRIIKKK